MKPFKINNKVYEPISRYQIMNIIDKNRYNYHIFNLLKIENTNLYISIKNIDYRIWKIYDVWINFNTVEWKKLEYNFYTDLISKIIIHNLNKVKSKKFIKQVRHLIRNPNPNDFYYNKEQFFQQNNNADLKYKLLLF